MTKTPAPGAGECWTEGPAPLDPPEESRRLLVFCRVCGYDSTVDPPWGEDGRTPTYGFCPCCGVEPGYQDFTPLSAERFRAAWLAEGAPWRDAKIPRGGLEVTERLRRIGAA